MNNIQEQLLALIPNKNQQEAVDLLDKLLSSQSDSLVNKIDNIANNLHKTLESFGSDAPILKHAKLDLPDASERLEYVIQATAEASEKTLVASENLTAILATIETKSLSSEVENLIADAQSEITDILIAQSFQDLTGQVLNRLIVLIGTLEQNLHQLIDSAGIDINSITFQEDEEVTREEEMKGVGPNVTKSSKQDSLAGQKDVDDLLNDLGI